MLYEYVVLTLYEGSVEMVLAVLIMMCVAALCGAALAYWLFHSIFLCVIGGFLGEVIAIIVVYRIRN